MCLWQRYAVRNALWWLEIEGRTTGYKKMDAFIQVNVQRFGDHNTLVAGAIGDKKLHQSLDISTICSRISFEEVRERDPNSFESASQRYCIWRRGFLGKVKVIGERTYALSGWLWETHLQKPIKESGGVCDVHIMHWGGLFIGRPGALGEPGL